MTVKRLNTTCAVSFKHGNGTLAARLSCGSWSFSVEARRMFTFSQTIPSLDEKLQERICTFGCRKNGIKCAASLTQSTYLQELE